MDIEITELKKFEDERGFLIEFLKGIELDKDYYEAAVKRFEEHKRQGRLKL